VQLGSAWGVAGDFLAQEEVGIAPQAFDGIHRVMICNGDKIHPTTLEGAVNSLRFVVALPADPVQQRDRTHARVQGVDVQIAPHIYVLAGGLLQTDDGGKNRMLKHSDPILSGKSAAGFRCILPHYDGCMSDQLQTG
jgi:hypothetical protein